MTNDSAFISEVWGCIKTYIPRDNHYEVCQMLVELFDSYNCSEGFEDDVGFEKILAKAIRHHFDIDEDDEGEYDE